MSSVTRRGELVAVAPTAPREAPSPPAPGAAARPRAMRAARRGPHRPRRPRRRRRRAAPAPVELAGRRVDVVEQSRSRSPPPLAADVVPQAFVPRPRMASRATGDRRLLLRGHRGDAREPLAVGPHPARPGMTRLRAHERRVEGRGRASTTSSTGSSSASGCASLDLDDEARKRLGDRVIVTRDGSRMFMYAQTERAGPRGRAGRPGAGRRRGPDPPTSR